MAFLSIIINTVLRRQRRIVSDIGFEKNTSRNRTENSDFCAISLVRFDGFLKFVREVSFL